MIISNYFYLLLFFINPQTEKVWYGKTFFYEVYCKKRNDFYTVELKGPKYYSIEVLQSLNQQQDNFKYIIAQNEYQTLSCIKKHRFEFFDKNRVKCGIKEKIETDEIKQKRLSLFYNFICLKIKDKNLVPEFKNIIGDFNEYDKSGDIGKIIQKYSGL